MKKTSVLILRTLGVAVFLSQTSVAIAGYENGNGGDAVVCRDSAQQINRIETLDLYEARTVLGLEAQWDGATTEVQMVDAALKHLEEISPRRATRYRGWIKTLLNNPNEARFLAGTVLDDIPDSAHITVPVGCKVEQVAIQREPAFQGAPRYIISKDLWDKMDASSRAVLLLHEAIYREGIAEGHRDSTRVRLFNAHVFANLFKGWDLQRFVSFVEGLPFSKTDYRGFEFQVKSMKFDHERRLTDAEGTLIRSEGPVKLAGLEISEGKSVRYHYNRTYYEEDFSFSGASIVAPLFYLRETGTLSINYWRNQLTGFGGFDGSYFGTAFAGTHNDTFFKGGYGKVDEQGRITEISKTTSHAFVVRGHDHRFGGAGDLLFWPDGRVKRAHSGNEFKFSTGDLAQSISVFLHVVEFDADGWLSQLNLSQRNSDYPGNWVRIQNRDIRLHHEMTSFYLHPGLKIRRFMLGGEDPITLKAKDGSPRTFHPEDWINLDEQGQLLD